MALQDGSLIDDPTSLAVWMKNGNRVFTPCGWINFFAGGEISVGDPGRFELIDA
jgi:hypothetical protein